MNALKSRGEAKQGSYANAMLTIVAVLLGVMILQQGGAPLTSEANAQRSNRRTDNPIAPPNAASQRQQMIAQLESLNSRMESLEGRLAGPFEVKVLEMPEMPQMSRFPVPGDE